MNDEFQTRNLFENAAVKYFQNVINERIKASDVFPAEMKTKFKYDSKTGNMCVEMTCDIYQIRSPEQIVIDGTLKYEGDGLKSLCFYYLQCKAGNERKNCCLNK